MKKIYKMAAACMAVIIGLMGFAACGADPLPYSDIELSEHIKVGDYKGLTVTAEKITVTKAEVQSKIDEALAAAAGTENLKKGEKLQNGDTANINYVGTLNGTAFEGGTAEGYDLELGSNSFIEGFESGLVGKKVGQKDIKLNLTFPENYSSEELAGQKVVFTVTINSATRPVAAEYNEDFIKSQGDYKTKKEYEKAVKESIYSEKENEAVSKEKTELWSQVISNSKVKKYPKEILNNYLEFNSNQIDDYAKEAGMTREEMLAQYGFTGEKDFKKQNKESSRLRVKQEMIIMQIADKEKLNYSNEEKDALISQFESQGYTEETILQYTGRTMDDYVYIQLMYEKVLNFIYDNANIEETDD